jgi:hypothetical protein
LLRVSFRSIRTRFLVCKFDGYHHVKCPLSAMDGQTPSAVLIRCENEFEPGSALHHHKPSAKTFSLHVTNPVLREGNGVFLVDLALRRRHRFSGFWPIPALSSLSLADVRSPKSGRSALYESTGYGKTTTGNFVEHWSGDSACMKSGCGRPLSDGECLRKAGSGHKTCRPAFSVAIVEGNIAPPINPPDAAH